MAWTSIVGIRTGDLWAQHEHYRRRSLKFRRLPIFFGPNSKITLIIRMPCTADISNQFSMHSSTNFESPPTFAEIHCSRDKVYHKQEVHNLLYILGQIVT